MPGWSEQVVRTAQGGEQVVVHERIVSTVVRTAIPMLYALPYVLSVTIVIQLLWFMECDISKSL